LARVGDGRQRTERAFDFGVIAPNIRLSEPPGQPGFITAPESAEELESTDLVFNLAGDLDLVTSASMRIGAGPWTQTQLGAGNSSAHLSIVNPALVELDPANRGEPIQRPVALRVHYGVRGEQSVRFDAHYALNADATPPTLAIVSPADGELVARGQALELHLRSFDRYGIDHVQLCVDSAAAPDPFADADACHELDDPTRFLLQVPADAEGTIRVQARALDKNGHRSPTAEVNLLPYAAPEATPSVEIVSPADGLGFQGGEPIIVRLRLRNLDAAMLHLDLAGDPDHPDNPAALPIAAADEGLLEQPVLLPNPAEDTLLLLRLEAQSQGVTLSDQRLVQLSADTGIEQDLDWTLLPEHRVLTGTEVWIEAPVPAAMPDFSADSALEVEDPAGVMPQVTPLGAERRRVTISGEGDEVRVRARLMDRSGHIKADERTLQKIPYLQGAGQPLHTVDPGVRLLRPLPIPGGATRCSGARTCAAAGIVSAAFPVC
jgi:hypothetical protein